MVLDGDGHLGSWHLSLHLECLALDLALSCVDVLGMRVGFYKRAKVGFHRQIFFFCLQFLELDEVSDFILLEKGIFFCLVLWRMFKKSLLKSSVLEIQAKAVCFLGF